MIMKPLDLFDGYNRHTYISDMLDENHISFICNDIDIWLWFLGSSKFELHIIKPNFMDIIYPIGAISEDKIISMFKREDIIIKSDVFKTDQLCYVSILFYTSEESYEEVIDAINKSIEKTDKYNELSVVSKQLRYCIEMIKGKSYGD